MTAVGLAKPGGEFGEDLLFERQVAAERNPTECLGRTLHAFVPSDQRAVVASRGASGCRAVGLADVLQFFDDLHFDVVAALAGNHAHDGAAADGLERGFQPLEAWSAVAPPGFEQSGSDSRMRIDTPLGEDAAGFLNPLLPRDAEVVVQFVNQLVPEQFPIGDVQQQRVIDGCSGWRSNGSWPHPGRDNGSATSEPHKASDAENRWHCASECMAEDRAA